MKRAVILILVLMASGCSGVLQKQEPVCSATAYVAGKNTTVDIYGVRNVAGQTQYRAGYPFNWSWVGKDNFINTTCN